MDSSKNFKRAKEPDFRPTLASITFLIFVRGSQKTVKRRTRQTFSPRKNTRVSPKSRTVPSQRRAEPKRPSVRRAGTGARARAGGRGKEGTTPRQRRDTACDGQSSETAVRRSDTKRNRIIFLYEVFRSVQPYIRQQRQKEKPLSADQTLRERSTPDGPTREHDEGTHICRVSDE